jgi:hypothetical protein
MTRVAPSRGPGPFVSLVVSGVWLGFLALLAYCYLKELQPIAGIEDPNNGVLAIAWVGSLGALTANFSDIARRADRWNPHLATRFLVRPLTGAAFGAIGYLIFRAVVQVSVTNMADLRGPTILGYVIAFALGYREEMFRDLLKRITDLLATAGVADVDPPSAPPGLRCETRSAADSGVTISWNPSSDNVAVVGYNVYRDYWFLAAVLVRPGGNEPATRHEGGDASVGGREPERISFVDRSQGDPEAHQYSVTAFDAAGNESVPAGPVPVHISSSGSALVASSRRRPRPWRLSAWWRLSR